MRGTRRRLWRGHRQIRFIPAHAGNTQRRTSPARTGAVHPRACGEHASPVSHGRPSGGSSPRMRGTPDAVAGAVVGQRFIPAHAGNTAHSAIAAAHSSVHPRACGEHVPASAPRRATAGSSPRMRGTPFREKRTRRRGRFIPAHAGNTARCRRWSVPPPVHPRACGEHASVLQRVREMSGSSPRMRGTHGRRIHRRRRVRFIPAHAGNTPRQCHSVQQPAVHPRACGEHDR